jgi:hypothetical protein
MIKKMFKFLNDLLGVPFYFAKATIKGFIISCKWTSKQVVKFIKNIPSLLVVFIKWFIDAIKESIAQIFTLLGFFIAWFTLTGVAQEIVGIAIVVSVIIWLVTIRLRD